MEPRKAPIKTEVLSYSTLRSSYLKAIQMHAKQARSAFSPISRRLILNYRTNWTFTILSRCEKYLWKGPILTSPKPLEPSFLPTPHSRC